MNFYLKIKMKLQKSHKYKRLYCSAYIFKTKSYAMKQLTTQAYPTQLPEDGKLRKKNGQWVFTCSLYYWNNYQNILKEAA